MQKHYYENEAPGMNVENHKGHNDNPDYWSILVKDTEHGFKEKLGLDFGCGCGRNVQNLWPRFKRMDGADISAGNLAFAKKNILATGCKDFKLFCTDGVSLAGISSDTYDFVMSTIVLQHIPVYSIRRQILTDIFRVMKTGGLLSFQMGFGNTPAIVHNRPFASYYENALNAGGTNSAHDVWVEKAEFIVKDLTEIGFKNVTFKISHSWTDSHQQWIYIKAYK